MGCCLSTEENKATQKKTHQQFSFISKSPPRAEEETVKEVLSETPKPKPIPEPGLLDPDTDDLKNVPIKSPDLKTGLVRAHEEEISDVSELCSVSESISTNTLLEREEDEPHWGSKDSGEVIQRVYKSQGQNGNFINNKNRVFSEGKSPVRRSEPSPPRLRNPGPGSGSMRRVDSLGRRSRSPANRSNVGRSPSGRRTGPSPGRVRMVHGIDRENKGKKVNEENENEWQGPNESLENPLVSLECFIFL